MQWLKQSTVATVQFGPFVDASDGVTLEIGLATAMDNATTGIRVSKNGAAFIDRNSATAPVYDAMGCYRVELSATDTNTLGRLRIIFEEAATCAPAWMDFMVLPANAYDSLVLGTDVLDVSVTQWLGTAAATPTTAGVPEVDVTYYGGTLQTTGEDVSNKVATILLDTGELQTNQGNWLTATGFATPTNITAATGITVSTMGANTITAASIATGAIDADAIGSNAITATKIAADAITASALAGDAVNEIQAGLATDTDLATVDANIDTMVLGIITGAAVTGTLTTTVATTNLSGYTDDQLIGRTLTWTSGVCDGEQTDITDYASTNGTLTYTLMTLAPGNGDTFKIT